MLYSLTVLLSRSKANDAFILQIPIETLASVMLPQLKLSLTSKSVSENQCKLSVLCTHRTLIARNNRMPCQKKLLIYTFQYQLVIVVIKYLLYPMHHYRDISN